MFTDDLTDYLTEWMASYRNIIICGDFNMHIDNLTDIEAQIFNDTMEALWLQQHVNFKTHHAGNILDIIYRNYFTTYHENLQRKIYLRS